MHAQEEEKQVEPTQVSSVLLITIVVPTLQDVQIPRRGILAPGWGAAWQYQQC